MKQTISLFILTLAFNAAAFSQAEKTSCPTLEVSGGGVVRPGVQMTFTVNVSGLSDTSNLKYEWEISNGTISSGLGTPTITIDTTGLDTEITAKVKVEGLSADCANTASEIGKVYAGGDPRLFDEFGRLSNNDMAARIQNLYVELGTNSDAHGYIFNYGTSNEIVAREKQIQRTVRRLKLDLARLTIINGGKNARENGVWSKIWIMPRGTDMSPFEN